MNASPHALPEAPHATSPWPAHAARLRWFMAEFAVVVAGVLVALGVSAMAQDHADRGREQAYLQQLSADLQSNERTLQDANDFLQQRAEATARVLHRFWRDAPQADPTLVRDLSLPRTTRRFRPILGTADTLASSGDLNLIRSAPLRAAILSYSESTRTSLEDIARYDETYYRPAVLMLYQGPDLYQFAQFRSLQDSLLPRPAAYTRVPFPTSLSAMLRDRSVYDGYNLLLIAHRNQADRYNDMLLQTRALKALVDAQIAR